MNKRVIYITSADSQRLNELLEVARAFQFKDRNDLKSLDAELRKAKIVESSEVPKTVVTMNTRLIFRDLDSGKTMEATLVFPSDANIDVGKMSVLSPVGIALLGYEKGDDIEWPVPGGTRRIHIEEILYQPEAAASALKR